MDVLLSKNEEEATGGSKGVEERPKDLKKATYSDNPEVAYGRDFKNLIQTQPYVMFEGTGSVWLRSGYDHG